MVTHTHTHTHTHSPDTHSQKKSTQNITRHKRVTMAVWSPVEKENETSYEKKRQKRQRERKMRGRGTVGRKEGGVEEEERV